LAEFTLRIEGMHCGACIRRVNQALAAVKGARVEQVRLGVARLTAAQDPPPVETAVAALQNAGYTARLES
jgi:copper chaperone